MGFLRRAIQERFESEKKPAGLQADIRMISGCQDEQTSADVSNVSSFRLPDPSGLSGGACTSTLLQVCYKDEQTPEDQLSFTTVLHQMREVLQERGFSQIPQLSASKPIDVNAPFDLVPPEATGTRRAVLIGINYVGHEQGQLSGCHNDVNNMITYIKNVHGFEDDNIKVLMDDGEHEMPTAENIINAYNQLVAEAQPGDALFCHYSGHGANIRDDNGDEADGYDESLVPVDYLEAGVIRDDDLYKILIQNLPQDVSLFALMDCCHSGSILDLPYTFKGDGSSEGMEIQEGFNFGKLFKKMGEEFQNFLEDA